jgi:hypothetical protein
MTNYGRSHPPRVRERCVVAFILLTSAVHASQVEAQSLGVQGSWAQDAAGLLGGDGISTQLGVGGRVELPTSILRAVGSFDYFFPDCDDLSGGATGCKYWEFNANLAIPISSGTLNPYLGGGLSLAGTSITAPEVDGSGPTAETTTTSFTETGFNVLAGVRRAVGSLMAYAEARVEVAGGEQFVLSVGVLWGR